MPKIGIVAGEASGDLLASHLIRAIKRIRPDVDFIGIAGPKMMAEGAKSLFSIEKLSVRGYVEVIRHLPELLNIRKSLIMQLKRERIDLFIGVDAPDFNFEVERVFKSSGIPAIHYISPSIWAWRKGRIKAIKTSVSHILTLFPFEPEIYAKENIPATFIGHPLADSLPESPDKISARETLKLPKQQTLIALLPGSRQSEVIQLSELFIQTAALIAKESSEVSFLVPLITRETRDIFEQALHKFVSQHPEDNLPIQILFGHAHMAMEAADLVIVASGTATLEAALLKRPMIITYKMPWISWQILKRMNYLPYVGLPNILCKRFIVPELLQNDASPEKLKDTAMRLLSEKETLKSMVDAFNDIYHELKQGSADKAASVVLSFLKSK